MRVLLQRVTRATVRVSKKHVAGIDRGYLLLTGVTHEDTRDIASRMAEKIVHLRILPDENGTMNRSALDSLASDAVAPGMLVVSQFTLYADIRKGRRPSFTQAARPDVAAPLVEHFAETLRGWGVAVQTGQFGATMQVELVNDGPVTVWIDSEEL